MLKLGEYQKLTVIKRVEFGVYLAETEDTERRVLLPAKQVPENTKIGDELDEPAEDHAWRTCSFTCCRDWKNRCIPRLGTGKRPVSSI